MTTMTLNAPTLVREISTAELPVVREAKTGDRLPDGSVLLWREDMNRMGLQRLRRWIMEKIIEDHATIAVGSGPAIPRPRDEMT